VKTLLTNWDAGKELNYKLPCEYLHHDDVERLMQQLAYWIHTQGGTGDKEGGTLIDKEELIKQLKEFIAEEKSIKPHQAKAEAERFVAHIQERAGLLNEQGQDCYAFVHKTFQEYLAAQEIKDRQEGDGDEVVLEHIEKYLHIPIGVRCCCYSSLNNTGKKLQNSSSIFLSKIRLTNNGCTVTFSLLSVV
jgi:predicted NACHT family NTPase